MNWISFAAGAVAALIVGWLAHTVDVDHIKAVAQKRLDGQIAADKNQCIAQQSITKEANDDLQKSNLNCNTRIADILREPAACVPVASTPQLATSGQHGSSRPNGLTTGWLRTFAQQCKGYKDTLRICEAYAQKAHDACNQ